MFKEMKVTGKHAAVVLSLLTILISAAASRAGQAQNTIQLADDEVKNLAINAKTAADHARLAQHFTANAEAYEAEAKEHEDFATQYRQTPNPDETKRPGSPRTSAHCYKAAARLHKSAQNARQL